MSHNPIGVSKKGVKNASSPETYKEKYIPDLSGFISLCDANYAKVMKLLPGFEKQDQQVFGLANGESLLGLIEIEITERCKYTTTLNFKQHYPSKTPETFISAPQMQVRLYHDAMMAEVLSFQGINKIRASYVYPNEAMHQKDEKALCNQFLSEWLTYCLRFGYASEVKVVELLSAAKTCCTTPLEDRQLED
jgi:uncharacterized protein